jgi:hypothetical protein
MGFASAPDGKLYMFGGGSQSGKFDVKTCPGEKSNGTIIGIVYSPTPDAPNKSWEGVTRDTDEY